ncbi:MAG TPA: dihydrolipoyl dehydrogenase [Candidatus Hydrogenedentes bacterium]|nr:dihydrolipoyl dehydrogenase [Candidatus Hydrogenedentota bacterium]
MDTKKYDVAVIGAGPGGYVAAIRAAQRGAKTLVVERRFLGGVCLNVGCIPTKTLIRSAELYRLMQRSAEFGILADNVRLDLNALMTRKDKVVSVNTGGIDALFKANGIDCVIGEASIPAPGKIAVNGETYDAANIIIATGGRPAVLPGLEFNGSTVIGSTEALSMTRVPERVAVIGAGALGAEFACVWHAFGAQVTLIEMMPTVLPRCDEELTKRLAQIWKRRGMDVRTGTKVARLEHLDNGVRLHLEGDSPGSVEVDTVLVGIGLQCNSEIVAANPSLGIRLGKRGGIIVNDRMETDVPGIYAVGDVTDRTWLAHGASHEGIVAATNATGGNMRVDYRVLPACNFTSPEVASVGLTEAQAIERGYSVRCGRFQFAANGRAHALGETDGMVKIVADSRTDEILGVHIMGPEAGELIAVGALAMSMEATVEEICRTIHTHPTLSEAILEAAEDYYGHGIHTRPRKR